MGFEKRIQLDEKVIEPSGLNHEEHLAWLFADALIEVRHSRRDMHRRAWSGLMDHAIELENKLSAENIEGLGISQMLMKWRTSLGWSQAGEDRVRASGFGTRELDRDLIGEDLKHFGGGTRSGRTDKGCRHRAAILLRSPTFSAESSCRSLAPGTP